jgi:hypothetical protein
VRLGSELLPRIHEAVRQRGRELRHRDCGPPHPPSTPLTPSPPPTPLVTTRTLEPGGKIQHVLLRFAQLGELLEELVVNVDVARRARSLAAACACAREERGRGGTGGVGGRDDDATGVREICRSACLGHPCGPPRTSGTGRAFTGPPAPPSHARARRSPCSDAIDAPSSSAKKSTGHILTLDVDLVRVCDLQHAVADRGVNNLLRAVRLDEGDLDGLLLCARGDRGGD